jgi:hypothetical protein
MKIRPSMRASGVTADNYYVRQYDDNSNLLSERDFWVLASPLYDYMVANPDITFEFDPTEWHVDHYNKLFRMIWKEKNLKIV